MSLALYPKKNIQERETFPPEKSNKWSLASPPSVENFCSAVEILGISFCAMFFSCAPSWRVEQVHGERCQDDRRVLLVLRCGGYSKICATYGECVLATAANNGRSLDSIPRTMPSSLTCTRVCPFKYSANILDLK